MLRGDSPAVVDDEGSELVMMFDCLYEMGHPVGAAWHVPGTLAPDGTTRLGDTSGVESARLLGEAINNPALRTELDAAV